VLLVALAACTDQAEEVIANAAGEVQLIGSFDWSVPERFGLDEDGDGRLDIPNTVEYVLNLDLDECLPACNDAAPTFTVVLDASAVLLVDEAGRSIPIDGYGWTIEGTGTLAASESSQLVVDLPEGDYQISLEVRGGGQARAIEDEIAVRDLLIVSIGDSFASGEGNPDIPGEPAQWADDGGGDSSPQGIAHDLAHRSSLAGPVQAALAIERANPKTSVTFVFLAASGASIEEGMLGPPDEAVRGTGESGALQPQLEQLAELVGCSEDTDTCQREIDALLISAGGNDIGFSFTLGSLIALDPLLVVNPIYGNLLANLVDDVASQIDGLPRLFDDLVAAIAELDVAAVYLTAYPDLSQASVGGKVLSCEAIGGDLVFGLEIDRDELDLVREEMLAPLNDALLSIAQDNGWVFVDSHVAEFAAHGYCGSDPYEQGSYEGSPYPNLVTVRDLPGVRWFRQSDDSLAIQGGGGGIFRPDRLGTTGTFHPNEFGHQAYKRALLEALSNLSG
jgi:lysophospholipase L1-like esterase